MNSIVSILDSCKNVNLMDEDGEPMEFSVEPALSESEIQAYESSISIKLDTEFRDLLMYANGMYLFGLEIESTLAQKYFCEQGIITFHNWGNGDFDCVATSTSAYPEGSVVFMNHSPDFTVKITNTVSEWLIKVIEELKTNSGLMHPGDYRHQKEQGLYQHVLQALEGRDCELTR